MRERPEQHSDVRLEFERIETPAELLAFMNDHVGYGFVGKNEHVYTPDDPNWDADWPTEYALQSPDQLLASGRGVCWDTVEFERQWFSEHGYKPETYFLMYAKEGGTDLPTHTFLAYEHDGKWYWFEQAFGDQRGIRAYDSREELIADVKNKHHQYAAQRRGATDEDFSNLKVTTYEQPAFGASPNEFVAKVLEQAAT